MNRMISMGAVLLGGLLPLAGPGCSDGDIGTTATSGSPTGSSGTGGTGGAGGASLICDPGAEMACDYGGPEGVEGVGACRAGVKTCNAEGTDYEMCLGEIVPDVEGCATADVDESCDGKPACTGDHVWSVRAGDGGTQYGITLAVDPGGNVYLTGIFDGTLDFGGGPLVSAGDRDVYVVKLGPGGEHLWSVRFGDADTQGGTGIGFDVNGNVIVTGYFGGIVDFGGGPLVSKDGLDLFVLKLDGSGKHVWSAAFGGTGTQNPRSMAVDSLGNTVITGNFAGNIDFGNGSLASAGQNDFFLLKLDPQGKHVWSMRAGDAGDQQGTGVVVDKSNNVVVTGFFQGTIDLGAGPLTSAGARDMFVAKFDEAGIQAWSAKYGDAGDQYGTGVAVDLVGNVLLTGDFAGAINLGGEALTSPAGLSILAAKLDTSGKHLWSKQFGGAGGGQRRGIAADRAGNVVLAGDFLGTANFGGDALTSAGGIDLYVAKLGADGAHFWSRRYGDAGEQHGRGVAVDAAGNVFVSSFFTGVIDFGGTPLTSAGGDDIYVAKLTH